MKRLDFVKFSAAGNDFILADERRAAAPKARAAAWARSLCDRKAGIGADGLILAGRSRGADVRMRIFNPDGSEAEMCGNGVRCLAKFALERRLTGVEADVETLAGTIRTRVRGDVVRARMIDPRGLRLNLDVRVDGSVRKLHFIDTGVPHAVELLESVDSVDVQTLGELIRRHEAFAPRGANADFVAVGPGNSIAVRTYERGVEGETLACGTGSTASALVAAALHGLSSPVVVRTHGGERLKIYFRNDGGQFRDVYLEGRVRRVFEGRVEL